MASINDNLFTILRQSVVNIDVSYRIMTQLGPVCAQFSENGLTQLYFDDTSAKSISDDSIFRNAFLDWVKSYQALKPTERLKCFDLNGTEFQRSVWNALTQIPFGQTSSYQSIAQKIGSPKAYRAVGAAVGANPISILIPCHRVIQASGTIGNYRWGADRKLALLDAEQEAGSDLLQLFQ